MAERSHLSIGEVLSLLQGEFPDVTISKIRFLESQGLLDPERTPSGYRKFYEPDIERLRWILRQQRENFLPLKVIRDRLDEADRDGLVVPAEDAGRTAPAPIPSAPASGEHAGAGSASGPGGATASAALAPDQRGPGAGPATAARTGPAAGAEPAPTPAPAPAPAPVPGRAPGPAPGSARERPVPSATIPAAPAPAGSPGAAANPLDAGPSAVSLTQAELAEAAGLERDAVAELERFGLLVGRPVGADLYYDGDALVVARTAAGFLRYGIEARHLRMYKVAAEREAGFFEQVVMPLLKQRNPTARQQAADTLGDLAALGEALHAALLRAALDDHRR